MTTINNSIGTESIGKLLLKFSVPAIVGMMVNSLYNLVDRIYIGKLGPLAMTGIGLNLPFMALIMAFSSLIGIGAASIISIRLGQNRKNDAEKILGNAFTLLTILMIAVTIIGLSFKTQLLYLFGASDSTIGYASEYITVIILIPMLIILPKFFGLSGVWTAAPIADFTASAITGIFLYKEMNHLEISELQAA